MSSIAGRAVHQLRVVALLLLPVFPLLTLVSGPTHAMASGRHARKRNATLLDDDDDVDTGAGQKGSVVRLRLTNFM